MICEGLNVLNWLFTDILEKETVEKCFVSVLELREHTAYEMITFNQSTLEYLSIPLMKWHKESGKYTVKYSVSFVEMA